MGTGLDDREFSDFHRVARICQALLTLNFKLRQVEDIDAVSGKILELGGKVALPKFAIPHTCWQSYFIDTEGNTFGIFEVDEEAK